MAGLTGYTKVFAGDTTNIDSELKCPLGTRAYDVNGNEYIYLTGVASTTAGAWVTFDEAHVTILAVADAKGRVAIAQAATVADTYGWYQIYGKTTIGLCSTPTADNNILYLTASPGMVSGTDVAGDLISGAICRGAASPTTVMTAELAYPWVDDTAND